MGGVQASGGPPALLALRFVSRAVRDGRGMAHPPAQREESGRVFRRDHRGSRRRADQVRAVCRYRPANSGKFQASGPSTRVSGLRASPGEVALPSLPHLAIAPLAGNSALGSSGKTGSRRGTRAPPSVSAPPPIRTGTPWAAVPPALDPRGPPPYPPPPLPSVYPPSPDRVIKDFMIQGGDFLKARRRRALLWRLPRACGTHALSRV